MLTRQTPAQAVARLSVSNSKTKSAGLEWSSDWVSGGCDTPGLFVMIDGMSATS